MILQVIIAMVAGWINRHQQYVITYLKEENRVLKSKLPGGRVRLTDTERRRLAKLAYPLSRKQLRDTSTIATPDTLMRCTISWLPASSTAARNDMDRVGHSSMKRLNSSSFAWRKTTRRGDTAASRAL